MTLASRLSLFAGVLLLLIGQAWLNQQLRLLDTALVTPPAEAAAKWDPRLFQTLTFGHWPTAIDAVWIRSMTDPAISHVPKGIHPPMYYDLDLATELDPAFFDAYTSGANLLAVIRNDGEGARLLLEKGQRFIDQNLNDSAEALEHYPARFRERFWSKAWNIPLLLAYVQLFELDNMPEAAIAFQRAAQIPGAPAYLQSLEQRLRKVGGAYEVGIRLLGFMVSQTQDERVRTELAKKRESLFLSQYLYQLSQGFKGYVAQQKQYHPGTELTPSVMKQHWKTYRGQNAIPETDPWGGAVSIDEQGNVTSTTPRMRVFGLE